METLWNDLRFAARTFRNNPGFALTAILTLALGIGASTAIFSVVNAVLLRPLPYAHPERMVLIESDLKARKLLHFPFPPGDYPEVRARGTAFEDVAGVVTGRSTLTGDIGAPEQINTAGVTTNVFPLLGVRVAIGRDFIGADAAPPSAPTAGAVSSPAGAAPPQLPTIAILSHEFWTRRYGGDSSVVGRTVNLDGGKAQIVGVLPPRVELLFPRESDVEPRPDMYTAFRIAYDTASRINVFMRLFARLKPSGSIVAAQAQMDHLAADLRERFPIKKSAGLQFRVVPMAVGLVADVRAGLLALMGAVTFVLLIACANVSNLLLVRASARERELAVRAALGSTRLRLVRQMLAESVLLAALGAALGLALAELGVHALLAIGPADLPRADAVGIDPIVLAFTVAAGLVSAVAFGIVPALRASRPDLADVLRASGRAPGLQGGRALRDGVVMLEVALSFVLLIGCGLMVRSFSALAHTDPGFEPRGLLTFFLTNPRANTLNERAAFMQVTREKLAAIPGVTAVTAATPFPLDGLLSDARWGTAEAVADPSRFQQATLHIVLPGYFETVRGRLIAGRAFTAADNDSTSTVVIVDNLFAAKAYPRESAVGKRIYARSRSDKPEWLDIIGVVAHERHASLVTEGREGMFMTDGEFSFGAAVRWVLRTNGDPASLAPMVRSTIAQIDPLLAIAEVQPAQALVDRAMAPTRFALVLITIFAVIAVVLSAVGLYGVLSTVVRMRTAEIGVRMAFGAPAASIFKLVIGQGLRLSGAGIVLGVLGALGLTQVMGSMLVGVKPTDPPTFAAIVVLFAAVAAAACWLPARRAASLDPGIALREEG